MRRAAYLVPGKEANSAHSESLLIEFADAVWLKIDKHTCLLFFDCALFIISFLLTYKFIIILSHKI